MRRRFELFPKRYGFFPYIFLAYLLLPILSLTTQHGWKQVIGYTLVALFLVTYRQLYFALKGRAFASWLGIQMGIIFILSVAYDPNSIFLGFFPANFVGWYDEKTNFKRGLFFLVLTVTVPLLYYVLKHHSFPFFYTLPFLLVMFFFPLGIRSMNRRMALEQELDQAKEQIEALIKKEERVRIARDLHDTLGHTLSLITLKSQLVSRLISVDTDKAKLEVKEIEETSRTALNQVRELVTTMRAVKVEEELVEVEQMLSAANISYHYEGTEVTASPLLQNIMSMCLKEAVTNVVKHSRATNCWITVVQMPSVLQMKVKDDGEGVSSSFGNGLKGMNERLSFVGGEMMLRSEKETVLTVTIPLVERSQQEGERR
ncbi:sensor histidine kinase [Priestia koreensis]|uniref:sensor histidine kinase n=1 Tax=Priestia koreensis TaxID=284581 RepID=UPI00203FA9F7|nr:sensor histidine kinase [Priestia koreensis]MCM3004609.1 sensor histidine kinase [Priestia koreensis]